MSVPSYNPIYTIEFPSVGAHLNWLIIAPDEYFVRIVQDSVLGSAHYQTYTELVDEMKRREHAGDTLILTWLRNMLLSNEPTSVEQAMSMLHSYLFNS